MIRELINFTEKLPPDVFSLGLKPSEGLHVIVELDEAGHLKKRLMEFFDGRMEINSNLRKCCQYETHSRLIDMNKAIDKSKQIHSGSPFTVAFNLKMSDKDKKALAKKIGINLKVLGKNERLHFTNKIRVEKLSKVKKALADYFKKCRSICLLVDDDQNLIRLSEQFESACNKLLDDRELTSFIFSDNEERRMKDNHYLFLFLANVKVSDYELAHQRYLKKGIFNSNDFNKESDNQLFGLSGFQNGLNVKKPFLAHHTSPFEEGINGRVSILDAFTLYRFQRLQKENKALPNPLPIFIDDKELNQEVIRIFDADRKLGFAEIVKKLFDKHTRDLSNYYLFNFSGGEIKDFDFVPLFRYAVDMKVIQLFPLGKPDEIISTIFEFEKIIIQRIFNNALVQYSDKTKTYSLKYFSDIDPKYCKNAKTHVLALKYRKAFYDFVYKSRLQAISADAYGEILKTLILEDVRLDEFKEGRHTQEYPIKQKLNIWFSLNHHFDHNNSNFRGHSMPTKIPELISRAREIANNDSHIASDEEFAFVAGQVIYFLLSKSEAGDRSHALLEPFLQKTRCDLLKSAIANSINRYKHAISFGKGRFEKLASEVLGYNTDVNMQELLSFTLAGYFSSCVIYEKAENN